jgi:hypothetical protein
MLSSLAGWFRPELSLSPFAPLNQHRDADHAEDDGQQKMK